MSSLLIDAGNSSIKWAVLSSGALSVQKKFFYHQKSPIYYFEKLLKKHKDCKAIIIVSVLERAFIQQAEVFAKAQSISFHPVSSQRELAGIRNAYLEPEKLGADRMVAMIAAYYAVNKQACIVIDAGTATTIDAVDEQGQHLGGLILPSSDLCTRSLLENTALLPQQHTGEDFSPALFSKETTQAINSASVLGLAGAIENICKKMENKLSKHSVKRIICGGNAKMILPFMESDYKYHDDLLMQGLKIMAQHENWISE